MQKVLEQSLFYQRCSIPSELRELSNSFSVGRRFPWGHEQEVDEDQTDSWWWLHVPVQALVVVVVLFVVVVVVVVVLFALTVYISYLVGVSGLARIIKG